ncbi:MAG: hypothetical protein V7724_20120 [Sediminicola sp.]
MKTVTVTSQFISRKERFMERMQHSKRIQWTHDGASLPMPMGL